MKKKEELRVLSKHLATEKNKTETLLYAMLPKHVANQLREGKKVSAGKAPSPARGPLSRRWYVLVVKATGFEARQKWF